MSSFLRHAFRLQVGDEHWTRLETDFIVASDRADALPMAPRRTQDRREPAASKPVSRSIDQFASEPDTDWSLPHHAAWAESMLTTWEDRCGARAPLVPIAVAGTINDAANC